jgi:membrane-associated phospholipid phosphatase
MTGGVAGEVVRFVGRVGLRIATAPARWRARPWGVLLAVVASTLALYVEKRPIQGALQGGGGSAVRAVALFLNVGGSGLAIALLGLAVLVAGRWSRRPVLVDMAVVLAAAGIWCWVLMKTGQLVLAERRPVEGGEMMLFALGGHGVSGHAAAAGVLFFPVRDVLARDASPLGRRLVTAALLAWAALIGWSRVWLGMHFVWNVELGLAIGYFTGLVATRVAGEEHRSCHMVRGAGGGGEKPS